jgi:hypothetical protein
VDVRYLWWAVMAASAYGGLQWFLHERPVAHPSGTLVEETPQIVLRSSRPAWQDAHGFSYTARADLNARVVVLARANYSVGEFAGFSPTDLAIAWGPLSDRSIYEQFKFSEMGSPLAGRFVFPEIRPGSDMAKLPFKEVGEFLLQHLTHIHTIPGNATVAKKLAGIRPGQVVHLNGVLVDTVAPSRDLYQTSLQLFDYQCEIMWVDEIEFE